MNNTTTPKDASRLFCPTWECSARGKVGAGNIVSYGKKRERYKCKTCGKTCDHTVKRVLADGPPPSITGRRYPPYAQIADPYQRRCAIVDLHAEGWSHTAISAYLQTPRHRVYEVLKRWAMLGHKGLEDIPPWHARKAGTREIDELGKLVKEAPELGAYRVRAALVQIGIHLSQATCGRLLVLNRKLYGVSLPESRAERPRKEMPFKARFKQEIWSVDVRYILSVRNDRAFRFWIARITWGNRMLHLGATC
jgi:hypothetical protein